MAPVVKTFILLAALAGIITGCERAARKAPASPSPTAIYSVGAGQFPYQSFSQVVAYEMKGEPQPVIKDKMLTENVHQDKKKGLTKKQTELLIQTLNDSSSFRYGSTRCFTPAIGYVFYDRHRSPVAHFTICLGCGTFVAEPALATRRYGLNTPGELKLLQLGRELFPGRLPQ